MRYHEFPSLVTENRIRHLRITLQVRHDSGSKTPNVTVKAIDLEYILDYVRELEEYKTEIEELFELEILS